MGKLLVSNMAVENTDQDLKILDLNNDCLIKVFTHLNYTDLLNVSKASDEFKYAVDAICCVTQFEFTINMENEVDMLVKMSPIEDFLLLFGEKIKGSKIELNCKPWQADYNIIHDHLESFITNYCVDANITECVLNFFVLRKSFFEKNREFFASLELLLIHSEVEPVNYFDWLLDFLPESKLKTFGLTCAMYHKDGNGFKFNLMSKIAASQLEACHILPNPKIIDTSTDVPVNQTIEYLHLREVSFDPVHLGKFPNIFNLTLNLCFDELDILLPILNLTELKQLELSHPLQLPHAAEFLSKLSEMNTLVSLTLVIFFVNANMDQERELENRLASYLCRMTNLNVLSILTDYKIQRHFPEIGRSLINLWSFSTWNPSNRSEDRRQNQEMGLELAREAKNLVLIKIDELLSFQSFYKKLVKIRQEQGNNQILLVDSMRPVPRRFTASAEQKRFVKGEDANFQILIYQIVFMLLLYFFSFF